MKKDLAILIIVVTAALAFMLGYSLAPTGGGGKSAGQAVGAAASAPGYGDEAPTAKASAPGYGDETPPAKPGKAGAPGYGEAKSPRKAAAPAYND
jgi:hypothetical protein